MLVIYASNSGRVQKFIDNLGGDVRALNVNDVKGDVGEHYILLTYTAGKGEVPEEVKEFLTRNSKYIVGVVASGNRVFGKSYGGSADKISHRYNVPTLMKFEHSGLKEDTIRFKERVRLLNGIYKSKQQNG